MPEEIGNLKRALSGLHFHQVILGQRISSYGGQAYQRLEQPYDLEISSPYKQKVHLHMLDFLAPSLFFGLHDLSEVCEFGEKTNEFASLLNPWVSPCSAVQRLCHPAPLELPFL